VKQLSSSFWQQLRGLLVSDSSGHTQAIIEIFAFIFIIHVMRRPVDFAVPLVGELANKAGTQISP
jgi:hypothetical protein